jgi:ABC-type multidrug transport system fused ATPase/permease subunit
VHESANAVLHVPRRSQQSIERGKIINLMSADVNNIINFLNPAMADIVVAPITIVVAVALLYTHIG